MVETYDGKIWVGLETGFDPSIDSYLQTVLLGRFHAEGGHLFDLGATDMAGKRVGYWGGKHQ